MQAGVMAWVHGEFDELSSQNSVHTQDGMEFSQSLQIERTTYLEDGRPVFHGRAAIEVIEEYEQGHIDDETGAIETMTRGERKCKSTHFLVIPDTLMVVESGDGDFAFELIRDALPGVRVRRATIDLNEFAERYYRSEGVDPWQVGFFGNSGQAEKGVVYGEDVFDDTEIGELLSSCQLNQLGLRYEVDGVSMKVTIARSGYVEVYLPTGLDGNEFAQYLCDELDEFVVKSE
ncbi:hypothetical protein [Haloarchaeobius sp. DFWS5]|uniref:hypothetical protein n=1 Tax=Haloarchaeobius sp. DFWS5 TaxID=3446114 RepID=UPI003EBDA2FF